MKRIRVSGIAIGTVILAATSVPQLRADSTNKETVVTVSGEVQIPGLVLEPGAYVFELAHSQADRDIVQVFDEDRTHLLTQFFAIPDYRLEPTDKAVIQLQEREPNAPQAIRAWFYAGESDGLEFIYRR